MGMASSGLQRYYLILKVYYIHFSKYNMHIKGTQDACLMLLHQDSLQAGHIQVIYIVQVRYEE